MTVSTYLRELYERFWRDHFDHLDKIAPHPKGSRASIFAGARHVTSFTCKDGILFLFEEGGELTFRHKSSGLTVQAKLNHITDPVGLGFEKFPEWYDLGPLRLGEGTRGVDPVAQAADMPIFIPRVVWFLAGFTDLNSGVARRLANDAHSGADSQFVATAELPRTFKLPGEA